MSRNTDHLKQSEEELDELAYLQVCNLTLKRRAQVDDLTRKIIEAQKKCPTLKNLFKKAQQNQDGKVIPIPKEYQRNKLETGITIENGMVCKAIRKENDTLEIKIILIPRMEEIIRTLLKSCHDDALSGHFGVTRTYKRVQVLYVWPGMKEDVKKYVRGCLECQAHKSTKPDHRNFPLYPSIFKQPNSRIGIDLIGPLPLTEERNQYALTCIDYFTKFATAIPIKDKKAETIVDALFNKWYCLYGIPYEIQSDLGSEFISDILKRINNRLNIDQINYTL